MSPTSSITPLVGSSARPMASRVVESTAAGPADAADAADAAGGAPGDGSPVVGLGPATPSRAGLRSIPIR